MTFNARARVVFVALCLAAGPFEAVGGVLIVEKTTIADGPAQVHQVQIDKDWMRMEHSASGESLWLLSLRSSLSCSSSRCPGEIRILRHPR